MQLPDDADVSEEIWEQVIDAMKVRVQDKIPAIRVFAVRALSPFAIDEGDGGIIHIFLHTLQKEQDAVCHINYVPRNIYFGFSFLRLIDVYCFIREGGAEDHYSVAATVERYGGVDHRVDDGRG